MRIGLLMGALGDPGLNTRLFDAARRYAGDGVAIEHLRTADLPPYVPGAALPDAVRALRAHASEVDGALILATQHLNGVTGPLKNALDWLGAGDSALDGLPVAVAGLASDASSTFAAIQQVRSTFTPLGVMGMRQPDYALVVGPDHFGADGTVEDVTLADDLASLLTALRGFIAHEQRAATVESSLPPVAAMTPAAMATAMGAPIANPTRYRA